MPGKYSHSVVLADLSSRGIINLPNDQHVAYLRSSPYPTSQRSRHGSNPWSDKSPSSQPRSKSAMAYANDYTRETSRVSTPMRQVIVDISSDGYDRKLIDSGYHQSTTTNNYVPARNKVNSSTPKQFKEMAHARTAMTPTPTPAAATSQYKPILNGLRNDTSTIKSLPVDKIPAAQFLREMPGPPTVPGRRGSASAPTRTTDSKLGPATVIKLKADMPIPNGTQMANPGSTESHTSQPIKQLKRQVSQETRIFAPQLMVTEPDFEGFSDAEEPSASYFEPPLNMKPLPAMKSPIQTKASPSSNGFETPSPSGPTTRIPESGARTFQSISTEAPESETRDRGSSPYYSGSKLDSLTSSSTLSSRDTGSIGQPGRYMETKKIGNQSVNQDWRLPEIDEDDTFDADFFMQGPNDLIPQVSNDSIDSFMNRPLGTVSAGRDVNFDQDDDLESEGDAACPPDIGRFRDELDIGPSVHVQKKNSDYLLNSGAGPLIQTPKAKKIGFFARLRSKNKAQD